MTHSKIHLQCQFILMPMDIGYNQGLFQEVQPLFYFLKTGISTFPDIIHSQSSSLLLLLLLLC